MLKNSYQTRGLSFAFLIGPPKNLTRQIGMSIHSAVCEALGVDDIGFRYQPGESQPGGERTFSINLTREEGRQRLTVEVGQQAHQQPIRLLLRYEWPASNKLVFDDFDSTCDAAFAVLGDGWQRVLAEARIRGQVHAPGDSAISFLSRDVLHLPKSGRPIDDGRLSFMALQYETVAAEFTQGAELSNPKRDVSVEVLRQDPRSLYLEVMSQWPQVAAAPDGTVHIDPGTIRSFQSPPSEYLTNTIDYTESVLLPFLDQAGLDQR
ncbi:hypothetical protein [Candidatus Palauibacter sp.]|uniref:hypothetical protein n=1 Tax=Candidatus Palauibacter sp. TaxID=3101350 RepID=UPI003AF26C59